jgi:NAD(P)-dependent dehydrogenase (short-subunit alcohol dehydrogenase family)
MKIQDRVFCVTGGASGLGEGACRMLCDQGGKVVVLDVQEDKAHAVVASLPAGSAVFVHMDATKEDSVAKAIAAVRGTAIMQSSCILSFFLSFFLSIFLPCLLPRPL